MPANDELGKRMKENYEQISKFKLTRRTPVIIRIDGKAFHTFTRNFRKPFDAVLIHVMQQTTKYLCEKIQGCVLGYVQSDEISLLLIDYQNLNTSAWFDNEVQKMCSISASLATFAFNKIFNETVNSLQVELQIKEGSDPSPDALSRYLGKEAEEVIESFGFDTNNLEELQSMISIYKAALDRGAMFDSRVFNIPEAEVTNYFYWRQLDAIRNSIEMLGQANFSCKQLHKKRCEEIKNMLIDEKDIYWNALPLHKQRGSCCIKTTVEKDGVTRSKWIIDTEIPIFKGQERSYVEDSMPKVHA